MIGAREAWDFTKEIAAEYAKDKVPKLAAALAYLTVFSLAPLLVIIVAVVGFAFGPEAARGRIVQEIAGLVGPDGAQFIETLILNTYNDNSGPVATLIGLVTLFIAATAVFADLQDSLNLIWEVEVKPGGSRLLRLLRRRLISFGLVVATGFLLLVTLVISTAITALSDYLGVQFGMAAGLLQAFNFLISLVIVFGLFAMMYRFLPDVRLTWREVRVGAFVTTVLFVIGKSLIGVYLGSSATASTFGAAASLAILLLWIYYSAQIFFIGAEFTRVYTRRYGSGVRPIPEARRTKPTAAKPND